ncbi:hypothetical protein ACFX13_035445 [Malus domestica]
MVSPNRESGIGLGSGSGRDGSWKVLWIQVSRSLSLLLMVKPPVFLVVVGMGSLLSLTTVKYVCPPTVELPILGENVTWSAISLVGQNDIIYI